MTTDQATVVIGAAVIVLLIALVLVVVLVMRKRRREAQTEAHPSPGAERAQDIAPWVLEGRRLFDLWQERIERLDELKSRLSGMAQEIEQLRAEIGHIDEMRAQITRLSEEGERYRLERDRLREALTRIASQAHEAAATPSS